MIPSNVVTITRRLAENAMRQTATIYDETGVQVGLGVPVRISSASASGNNSDVSAARSGNFTIYATEGTEVGQDYRLEADGHSYRVLGPLHNVTWRAELAFDCELILEPGEASP